MQSKSKLDAMNCVLINKIKRQRSKKLIELERQRGIN